MEIFTDFAEPSGPLSVLTRYAHVLSGVTWIGLLYFFNFVQVPAYAEFSDGARSEGLRKLTFRALWLSKATYTVLASCAEATSPET